MKLLADTHALIWFSENDPRLSLAAKLAMESSENQCHYSVASIWELAIKSRLGKIRMGSPLGVQFRRNLIRNGFDELAVQFDHAAYVSTMPLHHRDPFDRLLIAQAQREGMAIISQDEAFDAYKVLRIW